VAGGVLGESEVNEALWNAASAAGLPGKEIQTTLASAHTSHHGGR
jgi:hypothetical protein